MSRKITQKYYFSVEGETEEWYLDWLQDKINACEAAKYKVSLDHKKQKDPMKRAKSLNNTGKVDLWIILHKEECNRSFAHRKNYITPINRAYGEHFENMDEFKKEDNFKKCLKQLELQNVIDAVSRAKKIMDTNQKNGYTLYQYKGYSYYKENPALMVWQAVEDILKDCELV